MNVAFQFAFPGVGVALLLARILFSAVFTFVGLNHFLNPDHMTGYAEMKDLSAPRLDAVVSGGMLIFGGLRIALGVFPVLAANTVAVFLIMGTPVFHDFWTVPEDQRESEMTGFLENLVMLGGALVPLAFSETT